MRRIFLVLAVMGALLAVSAGTASAQADTGTTTLRIPFTERNASCSGEPILIEGTETLVFHITQDAAGGFHFTLRVAAQGTATGTVSGKEYLFRMAGGQQSLRGTVPAPDEIFTFQTTFEVLDVGPEQSPGEDLLLHNNHEAVLDADGQPSIFQHNFSIECR